MAHGITAYKQAKKEPFLNALARIGSINHAARAVRISRDAVYDWRRNDPRFAAAFARAKQIFSSLNTAGSLFGIRLSSQPLRSGFPPSIHSCHQAAIPGPDDGNRRACATP